MLHPSLTRNFMQNLPFRSDEAIMAAQDVNYQKPHQVEFFTHTLKLCHYTGEVLDLQYTQEAPSKVKSESGRNTPEAQRPLMSLAHLQKMLTLDSLLVKLNSQLPKHLEIGVARPGTLFGRQAHATRVR